MLTAHSLEKIILAGFFAPYREQNGLSLKTYLIDPGATFPTTQGQSECVLARWKA